MRRPAPTRVMGVGSVSKKSWGYYSQALRVFLAWAALNHLLVCTAEDLDDALCEWFEDRWWELDGKGRQLCVNARCAVLKLMPRVGRQLFASGEALQGWKKMRPPVSYLPMLWAPAVFIAVQLARRGFKIMGLALLVAWECYLRVSELTAVLFEHVASPGDKRLGLLSGVAGLAIPTAKTGKDQWASMRNAVLIQLLSQRIAKLKKGQRVFPFSPALFRKRLREVCDDYSLPHFVPHSTRHGHATESYLRGAAPDAIMVDGRWAVLSSLKTYLQAARARLLAADIPEYVPCLAAVLQDNLDIFLGGPW